MDTLLEYRTTSWQTTTDKKIYVCFSVRAKVKAISPRVLTKGRGVLVQHGDELSWRCEWVHRKEYNLMEWRLRIYDRVEHLRVMAGPVS